jgi:uncharacterized protein YqeY
MSLEQTINSELKTAMLAKDEKSLRGLRAIKAAIIIAKTAEGSNGTLAEADEIKMLQKLVKQRKDSLAISSNKIAPTWRRKKRKKLPSLKNSCPHKWARMN